MQLAPSSLSSCTSCACAALQGPPFPCSSHATCALLLREPAHFLFLLLSSLGTSRVCLYNFCALLLRGCAPCPLRSSLLCYSFFSRTRLLLQLLLFSQLNPSISCLPRIFRLPWLPLGHRLVRWTSLSFIVHVQSYLPTNHGWLSRAFLTNSSSITLTLSALLVPAATRV